MATFMARMPDGDECVMLARCVGAWQSGASGRRIVDRKQVVIVVQQLAKGPTKLAQHPSPVYRRPPWIMRHVVDPLTRLAVGGLGLDDHNGTRVLQVRGRTSGAWRATPVRPLELDGRRYLVAMYGETSWARNLRAQGTGRLRLGRHVTEFRAVEIADQEKLPVLRTYFRRWWSLVAQMTTVTSPNAPDEEFIQAAPMHPVFRLE